MSCVLGFDYGTRLIGVAVGNQITQSAQALSVIENSPGGPDWAKVDALLQEWRPSALLVGLPLTLDDKEQPITRAARAFATALEKRYDLPLHAVDERYTSMEASRRFAEQRRSGTAKRKHAANIDSVAAQIIVESWLVTA